MCRSSKTLSFFRSVRTLTIFLLAVISLSLLPRQTFAQNANEASRWAVSFSFTPKWEIHETVGNLFAGDDETLLFKGTELMVGIGRGSLFGGDWSISYIRKPFDDGLAVSSASPNCYEIELNSPPLCGVDTEEKFFENVILTGVEANWFLAFVRIKDRVQIGLNAGVGIGTFSGTVLSVRENQVPTPVFDPANPNAPPQFVLEPFRDEERQPAKDELLPYFPLGKLELMGSVILGSKLKVKAGWGLNFPGTGARIAVVYLF